MSDNFQTILIIGATSGIGEAFARRYHAQGKTIIATGRRVERLQALEKELPGLHTQQMDVSNTSTLPTQLSTLLSTHPAIDTIILSAGIGSLPSFLDPSTTSASAIEQEITTNLTAPILLAHLLIPHLHTLSHTTKHPTTFMTISSGQAFISSPIYPIYSSSKAGLHTFLVMLRAQLASAESDVRVVEVVPPYTDTDMHAPYQEKLEGVLKGLKPMPLEDFMDEAMKGLRDGEVKEVAVGRAEKGVAAWRGAFGPILKGMGVEG